MKLSEDLIEVSVIGGYLGAGKTTLVNHILREASERVAVDRKNYPFAFSSRACVHSRRTFFTNGDGCVLVAPVKDMVAKNICVYSK